MTSIKTTLSYFNIFNYPLTLFELWKWSDLRVSLMEILESSQKNKSQAGFYFLAGENELVKRRLKRYNIAERKFKKALKISRFLAICPFVKFIGVTNTLAYSNASEDSDIDFFIITKENKIWTARFYTVGLLKLFGLRPNKKTSRNKICLNFFVTKDNLNLERVALKVNTNQSGHDDPHFAAWLNQFVSIYNEDEVYTKFIQVNEWTKKYFPNIFNYQTHPRREVKLGWWSQSIKKIFEFLNYPQILEKIFKRAQLKIMPKNLKSKAAESNTDVVVSDEMLKFHVNDRRKKYREELIKTQNPKLTPRPCFEVESSTPRQVHSQEESQNYF